MLPLCHLLAACVWAQDGMIPQRVSLCAGVLTSRHLLDLLQTGGEPMSESELQQVLAALTGEESPEDALPEFVSAQTFMTEVLGFAA
jgi:hypothetical protein